MKNVHQRRTFRIYVNFQVASVSSTYWPLSVCSRAIIIISNSSRSQPLDLVPCLLLCSWIHMELKLFLGTKKGNPEIVRCEVNGIRYGHEIITLWRSSTLLHLRLCGIRERRSMRRGLLLHEMRCALWRVIWCVEQEFVVIHRSSCSCPKRDRDRGITREITEI